MRIISDDLWARTEATRKEVRELVAERHPGSPSRGRSGKHHSNTFSRGSPVWRLWRRHQFSQWGKGIHGSDVLAPG